MQDTQLAPTADVEKFKQAAERTYGENTFAAQVYEAGCHYGAIQARASLVAALENIRDGNYGKFDCSEDVASAALTGTGEKNVSQRKEQNEKLV